MEIMLIQFVLIKTAFKNSDINKDDNFNNFRKYRSVIAKRLYNENLVNLNQTNNSLYPLGYGKNQQEVLINSFLAAYTGQDPNKINLNQLKRFQYQIGI